MVIVEFPAMELQRWYRSAEYAEALALRRTALNRRLLFVLVSINMIFAALLNDQDPPQHGADHLGDDPLRA